MNQKELAEKYLISIHAKVRTSNNKHINIKCPLCGEGKSTHKARGYVLLGSDHITYFCHNCLSEGISFYNFLAQVDSAVATDYRLETRNKKSRNYQIKKVLLKR